MAQKKAEINATLRQVVTREERRQERLLVSAIVLGGLMVNHNTSIPEHYVTTALNISDMLITALDKAPWAAE